MTANTRAGDQSLEAVVGAALAGVGIERSLRGVRRDENVYSSSHLSEVLDCTFEEGPKLRLLSKCGRGQHRDPWGLRHGISYEASVYRSVLGREPSTPRFYGCYEDRREGLAWLFLEYLGDGSRLDQGPDTAIVDAAAMVGELHRRATHDAARHSPRLLSRYDRRYLRACQRFGSALADRWRKRAPAFEQLVDRFGAELDLLASAPPTVVHGECTPHNILWAGERPYLVDWEEAAIGAGEIDTACLTDEWDGDLVEAAVEAYVCSRWPQGPAHDFARTLRAARAYWVLRWLSYPGAADDQDEIEWVFGHVDEVLASGHLT